MPPRDMPWYFVSWRITGSSMYSAISAIDSVS